MLDRLGEQAVPGGRLDERVVLTLQRPHHVGDLLRLGHLPVDLRVGEFGGFAQFALGQVEAGRAGQRLQQHQSRRRVAGLGEVMRDVRGETDRVVLPLAEAVLQQRADAAGHLQPVRQRLVLADQPLARRMRSHPERPRVRRTHRDAVEAGGEPDAPAFGQVPDRGAEPLPVVVRLRAGQQEERRAIGVVQQVHHQFRRVVVLPVVHRICHRRTSRAVVDQAVDVEARDDPALSGEHVLGQQPARGSRVHEAVEVVQEHRSGQLRDVRIHLVQIVGIESHRILHLVSAGTYRPEDNTPHA